jgi:phytoene dehydrogenase-like protein
MLRAVSDPYDVIVIGGGFSGVTAARECAKAGLRTVVLEARERLGGRTHTTIWNGSVTELGGTWVHQCQPYVWAEIERYGLALADSNAGNTGQVVLRRSDGDIVPVDFAVQAVKILGAVAQYMGASSEMFPLPLRPFETGLAEKHDRVTAADPLADIADPFVRDFVDGFVATAVGNRAREAAWVEMVRWYALAGHNYIGLVEALARYRFKDGTKALIDAMVADGKPEVRLGVAIARVEQHGARARVTSRAGDSLEARAVISTLPLNVLCDVRFDPPLDSRKLEASTQRHAGASTKLHVAISGEQRISNFLLWQSAYAELVFDETLWPDFGEERLRVAVEEYASRARRFGARACSHGTHAVDRRCGHMNGPLEMGALDGTILTCPMHHVQFDVTSGQALNHPIPEYIDEPLPGRWAQYLSYFSLLMQQVSVRNIKTFLVTIEKESIQVQLD